MAFVPFIYFTLLTIFWWSKHRRFDVCVYMSGLWALTSFLSVIIMITGITAGGEGDSDGGMLWAGYEPVLGVIPTLGYCILPTITMLPFSMLYGKDLKTIDNKCKWTLLGFSALCILLALINFYLVADSTMDILSGDLSDLREEHYSGFDTPADVKATRLPYIFRFLRYLNLTTILALPLAFYYLCFTKMKRWFVALLFFSSLTYPIYSIQGADRTETVYFGQMFVYCIAFFAPYFTKWVKISMIAVTTVFGIVAGIYMTMVSMARFEDKDGGAGVSAVQYAGQGYLNYCYFCENADFSQIATEREFPLTNHFLLHVDSDPDRRGDRSAKQGFYISVFGTYVGDLFMDLSPIGAFIWIILEALMLIMVIKHPHRKEIDVGDLLLLFILASVPIFGIFYYRFHNFKHGYILLITIFIWLMSKIKIVYFKTHDDEEDICDNSDIQCKA